MARLNTGLEQKLEQKLKLSPQMIITAELLQKPIQELEIALKEELRCNPFLQDLSSESFEETFVSDEEVKAKEKDSISEEFEDSDLTEKIKELNKIINDLSDARNTQFEIERKDKSAPRFDGFEDYEKEHENLWEQFNNNVKELPINKSEKEFVNSILCSLTQNGYLDIPLENLTEPESIPISRAEEIRSMIMQIYPKGIGARTLSECLLAQLDDNQFKNKTLVSIIKNDLNLLQEHRYDKLKRKYNISKQGLLIIKDIIGHLDPKPGSRISSKTLSYIIPDIIVKDIDNRLEIIINDSYIPEVAINEEYARQMISKCNDKENAIKYIKSKLSSAENYVKALWMRRETLYKIATEIIRQQPKFFQVGLKELTPMTYDDISDKVNRDVSTVCRVVKNKYIDTPFGVYPLKWFFTSKVGNISSQIIKREIVRIIDNEDKLSPLSDQKIVDLLVQKEITISLRAVTKYRNQMGIPASRFRKK